MTHKHLGKEYITLCNFCKDMELKNTFLGLLKRDKRLQPSYVDNNEKELFEHNKLKRRLVKFNAKYHPPGYIVLRDFHDKSSKFTGYVGASNIEKRVLPLYKTNGKIVKSKKRILYNENELSRLWTKSKV